MTQRAATPKKKRPLTERQKRFVAAYVACGNASEAARRAGYSARNADVDGPRLLGNPGIAAAIAAEGEKAAARVEITQEWVLRRAAEEATLGWDDDDRQKNASSRVAALDKLMSCLGMKITKSQDTLDVNLTQESDEARSELAAVLAVVAQRRGSGRGNRTTH